MTSGKLIACIFEPDFNDRYAKIKAAREMPTFSDVHQTLHAVIPAKPRKIFPEIRKTRNYGTLEVHVHYFNRPSLTGTFTGINI